MGKYGLTWAKNDLHLQGKKSSKTNFKKPAIHNKQLPEKCPKNNNGLITYNKIGTRGHITSYKLGKADR